MQIVDAHNHIGQRKGLNTPVESLIEQMDKAGVDRAVVFSQSERVDNPYVAEALRRYPDRLIAFAMINPWHDEAEDELRHCVNELGFRGMKLHPVKHGYSLDEHFLLDPLFEICTEHSLPTIAYGAADIASIPNHFEEMARSFPESDFIIAHMGYMYETNSAISVSARNENIYLETSGVFVRQIQEALRVVGPKKIIWGSDTPKDDFSFSMEKVRLATSNEDERALIFGDNILRLLGE